MNKQGTLLIADDNTHMLTTVRLLLEEHFERIVCIANPNNIPARLRSDKPQVVLLDMNFSAGINSGNEGIFWLNEVKRISPQTAVVLFTAYADIDLAVRGLKEGAADFIVKPFDNVQMVEKLLAARAKAMPQKSVRKTSVSPVGDMIWGSSPAMKQLLAMVEKVADTHANILITGENGTGKEVLAHYIHNRSGRANAHLELVDMGAITETLFESELFGHVKGAFTDAKADKPGKFELAEGGTLFLDEIANLSYPLQAKLLTVLQRRSVTRVGGTRSIPVDVRLICATNRNLADMVVQGTFREDLLYRINTIHLHLPPLRERRADIPLLAERFVKRYAEQYGKPDVTLSKEACRHLMEQPWPGNIRELQHAMEKAVILCDGNAITPAEVPVQEIPAASIADEPQTLSDMERAAIAKAMTECEGNLSLVAQTLGITRQTLYNKIKKYGL